MDYYEEGNTTDLKGFEADFARAVCEKLGVTPTFQVISWEAKESELNSKNVDCLWNGLTITDARKNTMSISCLLYTSASESAQSRRDIPIVMVRMSRFSSRIILIVSSISLSLIHI